MTRPTLRIFDDEVALQAAFKKLLADTFSGEGIDGAFAVMLSGGSTPLPVYNELAQHPVPVSDRLTICFSDDRWVPADSPDSNYGNTLPMINALGIPEDRTIRVDSDSPLSETAKEYGAALESFLSGGGTVPLCILGLGTDGHTASLFSLADAELDTDLLAIPVEKDEPPHRISVTSHMLSKTGRIVFVVAGEKKKQQVQTLLEDPLSIPAGIATEGHPSVEIWVDAAAAP